MSMVEVRMYLGEKHNLWLPGYVDVRKKRAQDQNMKETNSDNCIDLRARLRLFLSLTLTDA